MASSPFPLKRIIGDYFDVFAAGSTGFRLKNVSSVATFRDTADANYVEVQAKIIRINGTNATNYIGLQAPGSLAGTNVYTLPAAFPTAGYVLSSDASGVMSWVANTGLGGLITRQLAFTQATSSPAAFYTSPANNTWLSHAVLSVTVAAGASGASIALGVTGTTGAYVATTDEDLMQTGSTTIPIGILLGTSPANIIATIVAGGQTFTGTLTLYYSLPVAAA